MKISFMLLFFSVINVYASNIAFSQEMKISVEMQNVTVRELIDEIEKKAGISFLYNDHLQELNKQVNAFYLDQPANFVLESVLSQAGLMFEEVGDNFIVLLPAKKDHAPVKPAHLLNSNNSSKLTVSLNSNSETSSNNRRLALTPLKSVASSNRQQQNFVVTGTVTSAEDGEPLPGVSVSVRGTTIGTVTDIDGSYSIEVPSEETVLRFSFVGMIRRDIMVGDQRTINVELDPDVVGLDEVVVTGYEVQRRRDLTGSVSSVRSQEIEGMPVESIQRAIQGRAAGVRVTASSGIPGAGVQVRVRGVGSFSSNAPLWIIDGVQVQTAGIGLRSASESILATIDFNDVESIDILKDAAATAIYGARGANGVIVVTTKRGKASEKTNFTFEVQRGVTEAISQRSIMTGPQWAQWDIERYGNRYGLNSQQYIDRLQLGISRGWYELGTDGTPDFSTTPNYNWQDEVHRLGNIWQARLSASGGDERTRFYSTFSHNLTEGHIKNYDFSRSSFRLNLDHEATDRLSFDAQLSANLSKQNTSRHGAFWTSPIHGSSSILPVEPIYDEEGNHYNAPRSVFGTNRAHVMSSIKYDHNISENVKTILNLSGTYKITDNFSYRASIGVDYNHNDEEQWYDPRASDGALMGGTLRDYETTSFALQTTQTLTYRQVFSDLHSISGVAGYETWERTWKTTRVGGENFPDPNMNVIRNAGNIFYGYGDETERAHVGFFSRFNYTYDDKYMVTLTGRYDGSSRFGAQNRWGFFPAVAVGWRISSEQFMTGIDQIDNLMMRLSYGTSGSDAAGTYAALGLWSGGTQYMGDVGIYPTQLPNEYLTWEQSRTLNLATSFAAFGGRLNLDLDVFKRWSEKLLLDRPLPRITGWSSIKENVGETINEGIELSLNTINYQTSNFRWSTNLNISFIQGEILELLPGQDFFSDRMMVGRAINDRNIPMWAGINAGDGRPMYYDKDGKITYNPVYEDRQWMGPEEPQRFGGLTNEFQLGNFGTSVFFQYSGGNYLYQQDMVYFFAWSGDRNQFSRVWTERWTEPGHLASAPIPMAGSEYPGNVSAPHSYASHMFQRADYIRLKDVSFSYNLPTELIRRYGIDNMKIFLRGTNLVTWTDYKGTDPEGYRASGADFGNYPQAKSITLGISSNF